jgi:hypothetical protein
MEGAKIRIPVQPGLTTEKLMQATGRVNEAFS